MKTPNVTSQRRNVCLITLLTCLLPGLPSLAETTTGSVPRATSVDHPHFGGLMALVGDRRLALPVAESDIVVSIRGDLASVTLVQVFENPHATPVHARYVFPMPPEAAVHAMRMQSGDRMIEAEIHRKPEARALFEAAKERGSQAALLDQHRPNVFTQEVANLMPGQPIRVEISYAHAVEKIDLDYVLRVPLVIGPRFVADAGTTERSVDPEPGAPTRRPDEPEGVSIGTWSLPASSPVARPETTWGQVGLSVSLMGGVPVQVVESPSHDVTITAIDDTTRHVVLTDGRAPGDRDFVLRYRLAATQVSVGATTSSDRQSGFLSLLVEPPVHANVDDITPREVVFVLDCSGSMSGVPLEVAKRLMRRMLPELRERDHFRIIRFSDAASDMTEMPLPATDFEIREALRYVDGLYGSGGTMMTSGVRSALAPGTPADAIRIVIFMTDGYIGNDLEVVRLIDDLRGEARLFSFGIGSSVNQYLIKEMARVGRGTCTIVAPNDDAAAAAEALAERLRTPVLTDIEIDWGDAPILDVSPSEIPDLFMGTSLRVMARYERGGRHEIQVAGRVAGRRVRMPIALELPDPRMGHGPEALGITWARAQIEDRMIRYLAPDSGADEKWQLEQQVTELGLAHRLVTQWTSFVAVAREVVNPRGEAESADVSVARVHGAPDSAYPPGVLPAVAPTQLAGASALVHMMPGKGFSGHAAPEPGTWLALGVLSWGTALIWRVRRRKARTGEALHGARAGGGR